MKKITILCIALCSLTLAQAQRSEIGFFAGGAFYLGDINPSGVFAQIQAAGGAVYRYNLSTRWAVRINGIYGYVRADDVRLDNPRNLGFRSSITELSAIAEFNFREYFTGSRTKYRFSPYLFGGVGVFFYNPQASYYDAITEETSWVDLRPLSTEGQGLLDFPNRKMYSLAQIAIPFGLGFKYSLSKKIAISLEWGMRKTFTDYIDDVSTTYVDPNILLAEIGQLAASLADRSETPNAIGSARGNSNTKDWYSFFGVMFTYKIEANTKRACDAYQGAHVPNYQQDNF
ncbi:hypothetical protein FACS1894201_03510 [Bacteroidia bacterium]|nr:hypothetical protein FACS1894201_03510 [Bacteroidia bacterium]